MLVSSRPPEPSDASLPAWLSSSPEVSRQLRLDFAGAIWHVTSRGNERREIFRDDRDRRTFLGLLESVVLARRWILHAYVLMDNHFHLLVETPEPGISRGMKRLNETWAQAFNRRHRRVGHLFQGRFKGILVERESHLLELTRYIVLNPVRCGAVRSAGEWEWSSYRATAGLGQAPKWLDPQIVLRNFHPRDPILAQRAYQEFVGKARQSEYRPWEMVVGQIYLGGPSFCERMQSLAEAVRETREFPRVQRRPVRPSFESIVTAVCQSFSETEESLSRKSRRPGRKIVAYLGYQETGLTLAALAEWLGVTIQGASNLIATAQRLERSDPAIQRFIADLRDPIQSPV